MATLQQWLQEKRSMQIVDVRPKDQREEWSIPGSMHADVYEQLKAGKSTDLSRLHLDRNTPVITVCAAGRASRTAAVQLAGEGYQVYSLRGGMKAWSQAWNVAAFPLRDKAAILQVRRVGKGCLSYIMGSQQEALVIDPSLDADLYQQLAEQNGWRIRYVLETHLHADHLSRARILADRSGATLVAPAGEGRQYPFQSIHDGEALPVGLLSLQALLTPGHTPHSFSYWLEEGVLFTGDTLFTDGVGRPDLHTDPRESSARAGLLYQSLRRLMAYPEETVVFPGHASQAIGFDGLPISTTLGQLKQNLEVLSLKSEDFTRQVLSRIPPAPGNYTSITERNCQGYFSENDPGDLEAGANRCAVS
ncbi:MAG: MBL fold metallo-hydrolase [Bacteroidetes bacterium]|nr:MBL fold metallo-hydrolase [Bacteroidota bacterium]